MSQNQPGGRRAAPGGLAIVQDFVNTNDREQRRDDFARPELMHAWFAAHGLLARDEELTADDFVAARAVREALRTLAAANNGETLAADAIETLDRTAQRTLTVTFTPEGGRLTPHGGGVDAALGAVLAAVLEATHDGTWERMKACRRDECRWLFYDHSRNRSSTWCSMAVCGNKEKTSAYRRRHAGA